VRLTHEEAPALGSWLATGEARVGQLLRNPEDRDDPLHAIVLLVLRRGEAALAPEDDFVLQPGDELLFAGWAAARRALDTILFVDGVLEYVVTGRRMPSSWFWRRLSAARSG
jgi:voltage-gated potassium channel